MTEGIGNLVGFARDANRTSLERATFAWAALNNFVSVPRKKRQRGAQLAAEALRQNVLNLELGRPERVWDKLSNCLIVAETLGLESEARLAVRAMVRVASGGTAGMREDMALIGVEMVLPEVDREPSKRFSSVEAQLFWLERLEEIREGLSPEWEKERAMIEREMAVLQGDGIAPARSSTSWFPGWGRVAKAQI